MTSSHTPTGDGETVSELKPGADLDRLVAERVMGLCHHEFVDDTEQCHADDRKDWEEEYGQPTTGLWRVMKDIPGVAKRGDRISRRSAGGWVVRFHRLKDWDTATFNQHADNLHHVDPTAPPLEDDEDTPEATVQ